MDEDQQRRYREIGEKVFADEEMFKMCVSSEDHDITNYTFDVILSVFSAMKNGLSLKKIPENAIAILKKKLGDDWYDKYYLNKYIKICCDEDESQSKNIQKSIKDKEINIE